MGMCHKQSLSSWLQQCIAGAVENHLREGSSSRLSMWLFQMLTRYQIEKAVNTALENGDVNLAALIMQIGGDVDFWADAGE